MTSIYEQLNKINDNESLSEKYTVKNAKELKMLQESGKLLKNGDTWTGGGKYRLHISGGEEWDAPAESHFTGFKLWSPEQAQEWAKSIIQSDYADGYVDAHEEYPIDNVWVEVYRDVNDGQYYSVQFITGNVSADHQEFIKDTEDHAEYWDSHSPSEQLPSGWWNN